MRTIVLLVVFVFGLAAPAFADDVASAQSVIRAQEQAFVRGDAAAAYSHAAPEIRQLFPQADIFLQMVQQAYPPIHRHKSFEFGEARSAGPDRTARSHRRRQWRGLGGDVYAGAAERRQFEDHGMFAVEGRTGGVVGLKNS